MTTTRGALPVGEQALRLAARGLAVFPVHGAAAGQCMCGRRACNSAGKHPRTKHGHRDATTSPEQIQMWWRACDNANIGVRTGNGVLVLDVDSRNGGYESLRALVTEHGHLPATPTVSTGGGGQHFYFAVQGKLPCKQSLWPGIDVKGDGGYVVAPPSVHASGAAYAWEKGKGLDDLSLAPAPTWLLRAVVSGVAPKVELGNTNVIQAGERNSHLMSLAGRLRRDGADEKSICEALRSANKALCRPPLGESEVERLAASVCRYPTGGAVSSVSEILSSSGVATLTKDAPTPEREAAIRKLKLAAAPLDTLDRAFLRDELVDRLDFPAALADAIVRKSGSSEPKQQGSAMLFTEPDPWPDQVNGAALLDELRQAVTRYVVLPVHGAVAISLWIVHTHALDAAHITPRLAIVSPEKRCGKSTLLKLLAALVRRPLSAANITAAAVFRTIETHHATLLVDEVDTFLRDREDLRGVLNAGHDRQSAKVLRCVGDDNEPRVFDVWAPVAFAGIGKQHDTLMDRSVVISMKRRSTGETVAQFRRRQREALGDLPRKCARWARDFTERLRDVEPVPPPELDDRAADNWEALLAIAHIAGGVWPECARTAALALSNAERGEQAEAHGEQLLADVRTIFDETGENAISAKSLLEQLVAMVERPWPEANHGRPLSARQLGVRLRRFHIGSRTVRDGAATARSYVRADFEDAFGRYLVAQTVTAGTRAESITNQSYSDPSHLSLVPQPANDGNAGDFSDVTDVTDEIDAEDAEAAYVALERAAIQEFGS
ncbi:MAG TPA: DUF3631 domain-containing protein [Polyangiaceae bacterium]|nr:DUF3631 domain-containing protein [Polyangiaceae bacterium]